MSRPAAVPKELRRERLERVRVVLVGRAVWSREGWVFWMCVRREEGKYSSSSSSQMRGAGREVRRWPDRGWGGTNRSRLRRRGWSLGDGEVGPCLPLVCSLVGR